VNTVGVNQIMGATAAPIVNAIANVAGAVMPFIGAIKRRLNRSQNWKLISSN